MFDEALPGGFYSVNSTAGFSVNMIKSSIYLIEMYNVKEKN